MCLKRSKLNINVHVELECNIFNAMNHLCTCRFSIECLLLDVVGPITHQAVQTNLILCVRFNA